MFRHYTKAYDSVVLVPFDEREYTLVEVHDWMLAYSIYTAGNGDRITEDEVDRIKRSMDKALSAVEPTPDHKHAEPKLEPEKPEEKPTVAADIWQCQLCKKDYLGTAEHFKAGRYSLICKPCRDKLRQAGQGS